MRRNTMTVSDRLGWFAYLTVMGGGIPFWPALLADFEVGDPRDDAGVPVPTKAPLAGTVRYESEPSREREEIAAA